MRKTTFITTIFCMLIVSGPALCSADRDGFAGSQSRDHLYAYLSQLHISQPEFQPVRESTSSKGVVEVEVCTDTCDYFALPKLRFGAMGWDLIFLFEIFVSDDSNYDELRTKQAEYANQVLAWYADREKLCAAKTLEREKAVCVLALGSKKLRMKYALVRYDEGYRCALYKAFDNLNKIIRERCVSVRDK